MILTDLVMPHMSGSEAAARLAATHPEARVLYMSGYTRSPVEHQRGLSTERAFIHKPFTRETLLRKVREVLEAPK